MNQQGPQDRQVDPEAAQELLRDLLVPRVEEGALQWLDERVGQLQRAFVEKDFYLAFGMVPRRLGKRRLELDPDELDRADRIRTGFQPREWTVDQAARSLLILTIPAESPESYVALLNKLFETAEVGELVALYGSLPLLPFPERHHDRAAEGIRTNMTVVFDAVALNNPYPHDYLSETAWNQLVLKAVFMGRPLHRIDGLDARANPRLAQMLSDFAHERWAAGRGVPPELWRPVAPYLNETYLGDIRRVFQDPDPRQQEAAALACSGSPLPGAQALLAEHPALKSAVERDELNWHILGRRVWGESP